MKKIGFLWAVLLSAFVSQAQYTFKVQPKTFNDEVGISRTITGIQARIVAPVEIELQDTSFVRTFYIAFTLESGTIFGQRNTSTEEVVKRAIENGIPEITARATVYEICKNLEYGTKLQKYQAAVSFAAMYGYELLPIGQQTQ